MMNTTIEKYRQSFIKQLSKPRVKSFFRCRAHPAVAVVFLCFVFLLPAGAQTINHEALAKYANWPRYAQISLFYELNGGRPAWTVDKMRQKELMALLKRSAFLGLNESDYQGAFFTRFREEEGRVTVMDSLDTDVRFTDAAIHFFSHLKAGNIVPPFGYNGLAYSPDLSPVVPALKRQLDAGNLTRLLVLLEPASKEYAALREKLAQFQEQVNRSDFKERPIRSTVADSTNLPLLERLYQLGITGSVLTGADKSVVRSAIINAQRLFDLTEDGVPGRATLAALNKSLSHRMEELAIALNLLRCLGDLQQNGAVLFLNLPAATLQVYENGNRVLVSKVVAGKPSTPTPTLTSSITEVIVYPYWNVTYNIATKELLPHIKRDVGYLEKNNYQVLDRQGRVLDPYRIQWADLSRANFPYRIRQSTGCDNSLGIVKFNFYNPFTVYLHDTPAKTLFASKKRFFSHGCMRVEKPVELARYLLGFNRIAIDTLTAKGCLISQAPVTLKVENPLPVVVLYSTAWYDKEGAACFYPDVYKRQSKEK